MHRVASEGALGRHIARHVISAALRTYREQFPRVASTAFIVFGAVAAVDALSVVLVVDHHVTRPIGAAVVSVMNVDLHVNRFDWAGGTAGIGPGLQNLSRTAEDIGVRTLSFMSSARRIGS